jgi:hypothetical protein
MKTFVLLIYSSQRILNLKASAALLPMNKAPDVRLAGFESPPDRSVKEGTAFYACGSVTWIYSCIPKYVTTKNQGN